MKKAISLALVLMLITALFASCGKTAQTSSAAPSSVPAGQGANSGGGAAPAPNADITWDSQDISWKKDTSPITYSIFMDIPWMPMDVWGKDDVSKKVTELTGVSFEVTKAQDANHLNMLMASGEYPDAIFVFRDKFKYEDPAISQPWNKLIEEHCPEFMGLIGESAIAAATKEDGNFYTLYTHFRDDEYWADPTLPVSYGEADIMFRDDVMQAIGNPPLETTDDFYNALVACKEKFPDYTPYLRPATNANGEALQCWTGLDFRFSDFKVDDSGKLSMPIRDREKVEDYLAFENRLIREGLMSVEGMTYDFEKQKQAVLAGKVFSIASQAYDVDLYNSALSQAGSDLRYTALDKPFSHNGQIQYAPVDANPGFAGLYITTACKEPARLMRLMEFMFSPEGDRLTQWGVEGLDYTLNADGLPVINQDIEWKERGDNVWYFGASFMTEIEKALVPAEPEFAQAGKLMYDFRKYWSADVLLSKCAPLPETPESEIKTAVKTLWENNKDTIVTAKTEEEFKTRLDSFYKDLERLELDAYTAWAQEKYDAAKAK